MSKAQGGRWSSGFWSGAVGTSLAPFAKTGNYYGNVTSNAIIGGTISRVTGGKFANGAALGAFRYMFDEHMHDMMEKAKVRAMQRNIRTAKRNHHPTTFERFNGTCTNEKYVIDATGARVTRNGDIISKWGGGRVPTNDEYGLAVSVLGLYPPYKIAAGVGGLTLDATDNPVDIGGIGAGIAGMTKYMAGSILDVGYSINKVFFQDDVIHYPGSSSVLYNNNNIWR